MSDRPRQVTLTEIDGVATLLVDGVVQSVEAGTWRSDSGYWSAMLPLRPPASALLLGLGGGTVATLLDAAFGPLRIIGVDHDPVLPELGQARLGLERARNLEFIEADAIDFVDVCREQFDYIGVDLYTGGQMERRALRKPFLRNLARRLTPNGSVAFNLFNDRRLRWRLLRLDEVLAITVERRLSHNVVVHCRARADGA